MQTMHIADIFSFSFSGEVAADCNASVCDSVETPARIASGSAICWPIASTDSRGPRHRPIGCTNKF